MGRKPSVGDCLTQYDDRCWTFSKPRPRSFGKGCVKRWCVVREVVGEFRSSVYPIDVLDPKELRWRTVLRDSLDELPKYCAAPTKSKAEELLAMYLLVEAGR